MIAYLESAKRKCNLAVQATEAPPEASSGVEGFIVDAKLCDKYSLSVKTTDIPLQFWDVRHVCQRPHEFHPEGDLHRLIEHECKTNVSVFH